MEYLIYVGIVLALIYVTMPLAILFVWVQYLAIMNLQRARDNQTLPRVAYVLGQPFLYFGLLCDCLLNVFWITFMFFDLPREFLVTQRLERYKHGPDGWRKRLAAWWATNLLDPFDPKGIHVE